MHQSKNIKIKLITIINKDEYSWLILLYARVNRRLAHKRSDTQQTYISHNILPPNSSKSRIHSKPKKVRFETSSAIHLHRDGISDKTEYNQGTTRSYIESLLLTIKQFLTQTQVLVQTFLSLFGKLSAAADLVVLGRLHL